MSCFCYDMLHCKKRLAIFPSPAGISLTKLSLAGNNIPGQGKFGNLFLQCSVYTQYLDKHKKLPSLAKKSEGFVVNLSLCHSLSKPTNFKIRAADTVSTLYLVCEAGNTLTLRE